LEDGLLVWRNRRGEATYCWKKLEPKEEIHEELKAAEPKAMQTRAIPQVFLRIRY